MIQLIDLLREESLPWYSSARGQRLYTFGLAPTQHDWSPDPRILAET